MNGIRCRVNFYFSTMCLRIRFLVTLACTISAWLKRLGVCTREHYPFSQFKTYFIALGDNQTITGLLCFLHLPADLMTDPLLRTTLLWAAATPGWQHRVSWELVPALLIPSGTQVPEDIKADKFIRFVPWRMQQIYRHPYHFSSLSSWINREWCRVQKAHHLSGAGLWPPHLCQCPALKYSTRFHGRWKQITNMS